MRAWLLAGVLSVAMVRPLSAATRVTIRDLKEHPEASYDQALLLECYYDKESPIWVSALPDADRWIGFFVTGNPDKALSWSGEYYNLLFAPRDMQETLRSLRSRDKITIVGEGFHYHSISLDGAGIRVQQILRGWGPSAKAIGEAASSAHVPPASTAPSVSSNVASETSSSPSQVSEKYAVTINGKRYEGLRFGDRYNFDGTQFQVDKAQ